MLFAAVTEWNAVGGNDAKCRLRSVALLIAGEIRKALVIFWRERSHRSGEIGLLHSFADAEQISFAEDTLAAYNVARGDHAKVLSFDGDNGVFG